MKHSAALIFLIGLAILATDCSKKNDVVLLPTATLTADGTVKPVVIGTGVLSFVTEHGHEGRALTLTFTTGTTLISVVVANWDFQTPPYNGIKVKSYNDLGNAGGGECLVLNDGITELCDSGLLTYVAGNDTFSSAFYDGNYVGSIKISSCDVTNKVVAGSFDIKVKDIAGPEILLKGTFSNIRYIVNR